VDGREAGEWTTGQWLDALLEMRRARGGLPTSASAEEETTAA